MATRLEVRLDAMNDATDVLELDRAGWRLHQLVGNLAGFWSITINQNWRITFRFENGDCYDVDLLDYH